MSLLIVLVGVIALCFGFVVLRGAPYVPTLRSDVQKALDIAQLKPGQTIVDLGSGDGRLLAAAADRGVVAVGYELNPLLVLVSRWRCRRYGNRVSIRLRDFWRTPMPEGADCVFVFLADPFMKRLADFLSDEVRRSGRPIILVSYGFELPGMQPIRKDRALLCYRIKP